jgi:EpsI family protein
MKNLRFWIVFLLLAATWLFLYTRPAVDRNPPSEPLSQLPYNLAGWTGTDQQIDQESLENLGAGDFVARSYAQNGQAEPIGLFIGYFPTQRSGQAIHSPKHCLPGAGWIFESSDSIDLIDVNGKSHHVGEYVVANGSAKQIVIYWYQAHGRSVANEYMAKIYTVVDAIRMNRTDGALVRVVTPVSYREEYPAARKRAEIFTKQLVPLLPRFIPD